MTEDVDGLFPMPKPRRLTYVPVAAQDSARPTRPLRLLDLYCCQGGAAMGYHRAGFDEIVGVDCVPQPRYPFTFVQGDAVEFAAAHAGEFDAVHASPPCDFWTKMAGQHGTRDQHPRLIEPTRAVLQAADVPYVIENVEQARDELVHPVLLCGQQLGLGVFRHRLFESSVTLVTPRHTAHAGRIGDGEFVTMTGGTGGRSLRDGIQHGSKADWARASGIDWMTVAGLREAIPPAYTQFLGGQLIAHLAKRVAA